MNVKKEFVLKLFWMSTKYQNEHTIYFDVIKQIDR